MHSNPSESDFLYACLSLKSNIDLEPLDSRANKQDYGRWSIEESQAYLTVITQWKKMRDIIKQLKKVLPNRIESQIRAHHQKMMKKYGNVERIREVMTYYQNKNLIHINRKVDSILNTFETAHTRWTQK